MKFVIALALFAVAFADEIRVVPLPSSPLLSKVSMGQVIVPNYVIDAVKAGLPVMRDAVPADDEGLKVRFADAPLEVPAPEPITLGEAPLPAFETAEVIAPEPVKIADAPLPAFETAEFDAVKFVDAPLEVAPVQEIAVEPVRIAMPSLPEVAPVAEEIAPEPIEIADAPLPALETVDAVKFVDAPLEVAPAQEIAVESIRIAEPSLPEVAPVAEEIAPEPVRIADAPLPAFEIPEAVKIAVPQYRDYRVKQFEDPRLR